MVSFMAAISSINSCRMVVYSRRGTWIFSATVWEENSAPSWNNTPQRISSCAHRGALDLAGLVAEHLDGAFQGADQEMMERNSTDLPAPEPPTTPSTSPR